MIRCSPLITMPFPSKTSGFLCVLLFSFSPVSTSVFSVVGVAHFHQGMDQELAVSTFPMHGSHQMWPLIVGGNHKQQQETQRNQLKYAKNSSSQFSFGILRFPLVWGWVDSMVFLWFYLVSLGFLSFPLFSFGLLWFTRQKRRKRT